MKLREKGDLSALRSDSKSSRKSARRSRTMNETSRVMFTSAQQIKTRGLKGGGVPVRWVSAAPEDSSEGFMVFRTAAAAFLAAERRRVFISVWCRNPSGSS